MRARLDERAEDRSSLADAARVLEQAGASFTLIAPDGAEVRVGARPHVARVRVHDASVLRAARRLDIVALAEAYVDGRVDVSGDFLELLRIGDLAAATP